MSRFEQYKKTFAKPLLAGAVCLFCATGQALDDDFVLEQYENYGIEAHDFNKMKIVPIHLMDNETLFLAAQAEMDSSMNMSQRLINNRWLLDEPKSSYSGTEAIRRYLRMYLKDSYKKGRNKHQQVRSDVYLVPERHDAYAQFSDITNYRLRVSDRRIRIRFRYKFD